MHLHRDTWREVQGIIAVHGDLPDSYWWAFMRDTYVTSQAVAVRRQADRHRDVASLGRLMEEVRGDSGRITRGYWIGLWPETMSACRRGVSARGWVNGPAASALISTPRSPASDMAELTSAAAQVKAYVDEHVAHSEARSVPAEITLTLKDVHDTIDVIGSLFNRYYNLLTASSYGCLVPAIEEDWKQSSDSRGYAHETDVVVSGAIWPWLRVALLAWWAPAVILVRTSRRGRYSLACVMDIEEAFAQSSLIAQLEAIESGAQVLEPTPARRHHVVPRLLLRRFTGRDRDGGEALFRLELESK
jgi:hypothetical protein